MAFDQDAVDEVMRLVQPLLDAIEQSVLAINQAQEPPNVHIMRWADGTEAIYDLRIPS